ncbi:hypothetical protein KJ762_07595 [bacterium]|nr:hypothetical protein [bacterium]MBU1634357.1 hypothetical protein [bacterium]MBU1900943.1 hypothetical protein [Patescibacteria group bacterium]
MTIFSHFLQGVKKRPFLVLFAFLALLLLYFNAPHRQRFLLDVGTNDDYLASNAISLNADAMSSPYFDEEVRYRMFQQPSAPFYLKLGSKLGSRQNLEVTASLKSDSDLSLGINCTLCDPERMENPALFNSEFYYRYFSKLTKVASFDDVNVYVDKELLKTIEFDDARSLPKWINNNLVSTDLTVNTVDYELARADLLSSQIIDSVLQKTNLDVRGNVNFIGYFNSRIELSVTKQDLNWYSNEDRVAVRVYSFKDHELIAEAIIEDDGLPLNESGSPHVEKIIADDIEEGAYIIEVSELTSEDEGLKKDFSITEIEVNTNKLVLSGDLTFSGGEQLYYESPTALQIDVLAWTEPQLQSLWIDGDLRVAELNMADLNLWKDIKLPQGTHQLYTEAYLRINSHDIPFALSPDAYFNPYKITLNATTDPDIVVTPLEIKTNEGGWTTVTKAISIDQIMETFKLPEEAMDEIRDVQLVFYTPSDASSFTLTNQLRDQGYYHVISYEDNHFFSRSKSLKNEPSDFMVYSSLEEWMKAHIPEHTVIGSHNYEPDLGSLLRSPVQFRSQNNTLTTPFSAANTKIVAYFSGTLEVSSETSQGRFVAVYDQDGDLVIGNSLPVKKPIKEGWYTLDFSDNIPSPTISDLTLNTNRILFAGEFTLEDGADLYLQEPRGQNLRIKVDNPRNLQNVTINDSVYPLTDVNLNKWFNIYLSKGEYNIRTQKPLTLDLTYAAQNEDIFFIPYKYRFEAMDDQDFAIIYEPIPEISLSLVEVLIQ